MILPSLYAILDAETCARRNVSLTAVAQAWRATGITLLQYRDKLVTDDAYLQNAASILSIFQNTATLIVNDRVHLVRESGWHGVHIGQADLSPTQARSILGPGKLLGLSTHTPQQVQQAHAQPVDYIACGPVFGTTTKLDAEPVIGLPGVQAARALTTKPLVAIGGITQATAPAVLAAGADSVAIISALLPPGVGVTQAAQDFLAALK